MCTQAYAHLCVSKTDCSHSHISHAISTHCSNHIKVKEIRKERTGGRKRSGEKEREKQRQAEMVVTRRELEAAPVNSMDKDKWCATAL